MKQSTKKFIATWYINVGNIRSIDAISYMKTVKVTFDSSKLEKLLGVDNVATYFIPTRTGETRLEIITLDSGLVGVSDQETE